MDNNLKAKVLAFLYKWVNDGKLAHLRKGMVEELVEFLLSILSEAQITQIAEKMQAQLPKDDNAQDSK